MSKGADALKLERHGPPRWAIEKAKDIWEAAKSAADPIDVIARRLARDDGPLLRGTP
jgi:hypothetical protein